MKKQGLLLTNHRGYITGLGPQFGHRYTVTGRDRKSSPIRGSVFIDVKSGVPRFGGSLLVCLKHNVQAEKHRVTQMVS